MTAATPIRVLIADDMATLRELFATWISSAPDMRVVGTVSNGREAVVLARRERPDLILMDWDMPELDGIQATREIMHTAPTPVVIVSSTPHIAGAALDAGAVEFLPKSVTAAKLLESIRVLSQVKVVRQHAPRPARPQGSVTAAGGFAVVGIGASTGGPRTLSVILSQLPAGLPPLVIVQHVGEGFAANLAEWLSESSGYGVEVAQPGTFLSPGRAYIAIDGKHLRIGRSFLVDCEKSSPVKGVMPSVDVLFQSLARSHGREAIGILLTGMGRDGAEGLLEMRRAGGRTIAQDRETAVIDGMPKAARDLGAAEWVVGQQDIARALLALLAGEPADPRWLQDP